MADKIAFWALPLAIPSQLPNPQARGPAVKPKKVWSIVMIVLGGLTLLGGAQQYHHQVVPENTSTFHEASLAGLGGNFRGEGPPAFNKKDMSPKEKMLAIAIILIGGLLAIVGALMLNQTVPKPIDTFEIDFEKDALEGPRFKL